LSWPDGRRSQAAAGGGFVLRVGLVLFAQQCTQIVAVTLVSETAAAAAAPDQSVPEKAADFLTRSFALMQQHPQHSHQFPHQASMSHLFRHYYYHLAEAHFLGTKNSGRWVVWWRWLFSVQCFPISSGRFFRHHFAVQT